VWYRAGSYTGHENSATGWTLLASGTANSAGQDARTVVTLNNSVTFLPGQKYGIYVDLTSYGSHTLRYSDGPPVSVENSFLKLTTGIAKGPGFPGATLTQRRFSGVIWYQGASGHHQLTTSFAGGNGFAGNMFAVQPLRDIRVHAFDLHVEDPATLETVTADVYYRAGYYVGHEQDPYAWTFLGSDSTAWNGTPTRITIPGVELNGGTTYAFYIHLASYHAGQRLLYSDGFTTYQNDDLIITAGVGKGDEAFTGPNYLDRIWNGTIHYSQPAWTDLGYFLAGSAGTPRLTGVGTLLPRQPVSLLLQPVQSNSIALLIVGNTSLLAPWKGGVLVPSPTAIFPFPTGALGRVLLGGYWPAHIPQGTETYLQFWTADPGGPRGYSASNALIAVSQ
jgi:hypothetical protein